MAVMMRFNASTDKNNTEYNNYLYISNIKNQTLQRSFSSFSFIIYVVSGFNFYNMRKFLDKYFGVLFALGIVIGGISPLFQYKDNILNPLFMWGGVLLCGGSLLYYAINIYTRL